VMALAPGGSLDAAIAEGRFASVPETVKVLAGIARGMEAVHNQKLIHLDLKPENVLLGPLNVPWVTDFGLSTSSNLASMSTSSAGGRGTLFYKAPELFAYPPVITPFADVYAYAILCWVTCTGEASPYSGLQSAETAMASMLGQGIRPALSSGEDWRDMTTGGLAKLIEACWVTEHEARPTFGGEDGLVRQLDDLERRLLKNDATATMETMLERVWAAENEKAVAVELMGEYDAASAAAQGEEQTELAEERAALDTTRAGVEASSAAAQQTLQSGGHGELLQQVMKMVAEMSSTLQQVKQEVRTSNVTLESLAMDELDCPRLVFLTPYLPPEQRSLAARVQRVAHRLKSVAQDKQRLVFLDPVTGAAVPCGKDGQGYVLTLPSEFLAAHAKHIKDGLKIVKLALALGRCAGLPLPEAGCGLPTEVISKAEALAVQQFELLLASGASAEGLAEESSDGRSRSRKSLTSGRASNTAAAATGKAYRALLSLVEKQCGDPHLLQCGLERVRADDGTVEWVTQGSKARFELEGAACLIWNRHELSDEGRITAA